MRRPGHLPRGDAAHLGELLHEVLLRVEPAGRVHEERPSTPRAFAAESASKRTAEGSAPSRWRTTGSAQPLAPDAELLDRPGAKRVRRGQQHRCALGDAARAASLAVVVVLPEPLTPTRKTTSSGTRRPRRRPRRRREEPLDLLDQEPRAALPGPCARRTSARCRTRLGQRRGGLRADVGLDQRLLERLENGLVDPEPLLDRRPELLEDLGVGHEQPAPDLREETAACGGGARASDRRSWEGENIASSEPKRDAPGAPGGPQDAPRSEADLVAGRRRRASRTRRALAAGRRPSGRSRPPARGSGSRASRLLHLEQRQAQAQVRVRRCGAAGARPRGSPRRPPAVRRAPPARSPAEQRGEGIRIPGQWPIVNCSLRAGVVALHLPQPPAVDRRREPVLGDRRGVGDLEVLLGLRVPRELACAPARG